MRQAGPLKAIEFFEAPEAKWVILFHGYGADASDLSSLQGAVNLAKPCNWLFPDAHISVPIGPGWTGRAWWEIRMNDLPGDWSDLRPPGMDSAVEKINKMMASMKFDWKDVIIGGFSQGAMLATEVFLNAPETPAGLICMSGTLLSKNSWAGVAAKRKGSSILMSHGEADPVLPHKGSVALQKFFEEQGVKTQFVSFRGGHEIPMQVIDKMKHYINERLT